MRIKKLNREYLDKAFGFEKNFLYVKMILDMDMKI
jgi:hypothetical protein